MYLSHYCPVLSIPVQIPPPSPEPMRVGIQIPPADPLSTCPYLSASVLNIYLKKLFIPPPTVTWLGLRGPSTLRALYSYFLFSCSQDILFPPKITV